MGSSVIRYPTPRHFTTQTIQQPMKKSHFDCLLFAMFLLSGITALVYEVIWEKYMAHFLGAGAYSQAIVLSTFMLGLGVGSRIFGRYAEKTNCQLRLYALIEAGIGVYALAFPFLMKLGESAFVRVITNDTNFTTVLITKFVISFLIMSGPAVLMGGTLPVISKYIIRHPSYSGRNLSRLYFINALGAVIGCILAGFYLIRLFGLQPSLYAAAAINILIGLVVYALKDRIKDDSVAKPTVVDTETPGRRFFSIDETRCLMRVAFLSGLAAMLYEIAWIRILSNVLGSSTYSFSLMLAVFILGIAVGSLIVSYFIDRVKDITFSVIILEILLIVTIIATLPIYNRLPYIFHILSNSLTHSSQTYPVFFLLQAALCAVVMFPASLFSGMILPMLGAGVMSKLDCVGEKIGTLFAFNTFGTILAALSTGLFLIPAIGTLNTIFIGLGINAVIILLLFAIWDARRATKYGLAGGLLILFIITFVRVPDFNPYVFLSSEFRHRNQQTYDSFTDYVEHFSSEYKILFYNEGVTSTIAVTEEDSGNRALFINGKADASTSIHGDLITQTLLGLIPNLVAPGGKRTLVIGMGTGTTAHVSSLPDSVQSVDVVEISEDVITALPYFSEVNHDLASNPKIAIHVEDAKTFLNLADDKYDVIISEPSNPWIAGIGNLFSVEYYQQVVESLNDDGTFTQWLQTYETSDSIVLSVLYSLRKVFPDLDIWYSGQKDLIITCYKSERQIDLAEGRRVFDQLKIAIANSRIQNFEEVLLRHMADTDVVDQMLQTRAPVENSDEAPFIEYEAPIHLFYRTPAIIPDLIDQRLLPRKVTAYPFLHALPTSSPDAFFSYFRNFQVQTPITKRVRILEVMHKGLWYIEDPWARKYYLGNLESYYEGADTKEKRSWYLTRLYEEYENLKNCFVPVPFVPFLVEKTTAYTEEFPEDTRMGEILAELSTTE